MANNKIIHLSQRDFLIKRINIYFGRELGNKENNPFSSQKQIAVREIIDNAIDAIRKKKEDGNIRVTFNEDFSVECWDSGGGIPLDITKNAEGVPVSSLYLALGVMNAGSNYENVSDSLGTNGVGSSATVNLSNYVKVEVFKGNKVYSLDFKDGKPGFFNEKEVFEEITDLTLLKKKDDYRTKEERETFGDGTKIIFQLNNKLFKSPFQYNEEELIEGLKGAAYQVKGLNIEIINHLKKNEDGESYRYYFKYENGLRDLLDFISINPVTEVFEISNNGILRDETIDINNNNNQVKVIEKEVSVNLVFNYTNDNEYIIDSYVNTIKTRLGGFHCKAFESSFTEVLNKKLRALKILGAKDKDPIFKDYSEGLVAIVSVNIPEPEFTNQIKEELGGVNALKKFTELFTQGVEKWSNLLENQEVIKLIGERVKLNAKDREKSKELQEIRKKQRKIEKNSVMPPKLVDCELNYDKNAELYILEGDSALGGCKAARNSYFQALIPLRGKLINIEKQPLKKVLANQEIQDIIKALDCGVGNSFDVNKMRYGRVIIGTDADVDGGDISTQILVNIYRLFPGLIENGRLFKACTPLFIIKEKNKNHYYYTLEDYEKDLPKFKNKKISIVRAKGLGETGEDILFETAFNLETRTLEQITLEDVKEVEEWLNITMGDAIDKRKDWIESNPMNLEKLGE